MSNKKGEKVAYTKPAGMGINVSSLSARRAELLAGRAATKRWQKKLNKQAFENSRQKPANVNPDTQKEEGQDNGQ